MIVGIGSDLIDIRRIEKSLERHGERFVQRIFTETEQARAEGRAHRAATYAKRFAAKEACAKALGCGFGQHAAWREIGVENDAAGRPALALTGAARETLTRLTPPGFAPRLTVSLSDEPPLAVAFVVISAEPAA